MSGIEPDDNDGDKTVLERPAPDGPASGLTYRQPEHRDLEAVHRIHADPRTNTHNPAGPDDRQASAHRLRSWLEHWRDHGFGYWVIEDEHREIVGFSGLRHVQWLGRPALNLYYRFSPSAWGKGYAKAAATRAVNWAATSYPELPVVARTRPGNIASQRTAAAAGLVRTPGLEANDDGPAVVYASVTAMPAGTPSPRPSPPASAADR